MIADLAPGYALQRAQHRQRLAATGRPRGHYDGASRGRRLGDWRTPFTGPNTEIARDLRWLTMRSHDLVRNNAWAARAVSIIPRNVVGAGILYSVQHQNSRLLGKLKPLLDAHLGSTAIDAGGRHDLYGLQRLAMRTIVEGGSILARRRRRFASDGLPLPFQVQLLEPEHLDTSRRGALEGGGYIAQGVEFDVIGRRVAYWLYDAHPGDAIRPGSTASRRIPAADVLHVYREDRPAQITGVPWLAPVIVSLRDFQDYEDGQLLRQKIAAAFAVIETSTEAVVDTDTTKPFPRETPIQPGMIVQATPGYDVRFPNPPSVDGYADYSRVTARKIAAGVDVPYEALTGDLTQVNFSSGRMGWLEFQRAIEEWRWLMLIPGFCQGVMTWALETAETTGGILGAQAAKIDWTPPRREMIDPVKETTAARAAIRAGLATPSEVIRAQGYDPELHFAEYARDMQRLDELGIVVDSDVRQDGRSSGAVKPQADSSTDDQQQEPANG